MAKLEVMHAVTVRQRSAMLGSSVQDRNMSGAILYDGWCGEPIAWARVGDLVIGQEWTEHGSVAVTSRLSPVPADMKKSGWADSSVRVGGHEISGSMDMRSPGHA
ncbi:hypothetical protein DMA12_21180 [Amycolatopsis balhimycina DSM 5908]|uniref:Uncharacterized protein n=1 Tax=Amycolatopsis balhimycina DSM 5908 TaxID=1081091 RepID=A0A428WH73_AMYBA|nr:hypothetical protein [Amycolatopsis balhimycina]RSM42438.1 hypothetical protein DMA12_21180 [Amycolatopsis balhimycina DSM 5908]